MKKLYISYVGEILSCQRICKEPSRKGSTENWKFTKRRLNPMDTVESSNQYVSGMAVKNSHRVSLYNIR